MRSLLLSALLVGNIICQAQTGFTIYDQTNSDLPTNLVNALTIDEQNNVWVGTEGGLVKIDVGGTWTTYTTANSGIPDNAVRSIYVDEDQVVWVGTYLDGMASFDGTDWVAYDPTNSGLPDYHIKSITKDQHDTMWIGTSWGLAKWDGADYWYTYTELNSEILVPNINALYMDANEILYAGSLNGGLVVYDHGAFSIYRTANSTISDNTILSIDEDIYHNKWLATSFGGLSVLTESGDFLKFTPLTSDISDWSVDAVRLDNNNIGIIGMSATGLEIFDNINWTNYSSDNSELPNDYINALAVDTGNIIWIGTEEGGLARFDREALAIDAPETVRILTYPNPATDNALIVGLPAQLDLQVYNDQGIYCGDAEYINGVYIIRATSLAAGMYMVRAVDTKFVYTGTLTVVH